MQLPFRREALRERDRLDQEDEDDAARGESPAARVELTLELSELAHAIGEGASATWLTAPADDLAEKARLYVLPLARVSGRP